MALRLFWTGHGYSATTSTAATQMKTNALMFDIYNNNQSALNGSTGRFTGTRGIGIGDSSTWGNAASTVIPFESDNVVRGAADIYLKSGVTNFFVFSYTNGVYLGTSGSVSDAMQGANTFFAVERTATGFLQLRVNNVIAVTGTTTVALDTWYHIEWEADVEVAGTFNLWLDNTLELNYSGNIRNGITPSVYRFRFGNARVNMSGLYLWDNAAVGAFNAYVGDFEPVQLLPDGNGTTNQGTPVGAASNYQCVDETFRNGDTDYVQMIYGQEEYYTYTTLAGTPTILTVLIQPAFRAVNGRTALYGICDSNGTVVSSANSQPRSNNGLSWGTYGPVSFVAEFEVDPDTGVAWDAAGVNAAEFGVGAVT